MADETKVLHPAEVALAEARTRAADTERELNEIKADQARVHLEQARIGLAEMQREHRDAEASASESGVYHFMNAVGAESSKMCILTLDMWSRRRPGTDFKIVFNSPGGSVFHGLALYDFIDELKDRGHTITTVARGMAASMGGILLQAGDTRIIGANAHMLIHEVSAMEAGKVSEMEEQLEFTKRLQKRCLNILASRSTMNPAQISRRWKKHDWWLDANEVVELGFADEIG